jgi:1-acyl-sn-glycerol-3-phosphate acyltransferase
VTLRRNLVNGGVRLLSQMLVRMDPQALDSVPPRGPLIIAANHVNFMEAPLMITHMLPRPLTVVTKPASFEKPFRRFFFQNWDSIIVTPGQGDRQSFLEIQAALADGRIVAILPEGTRSGDGCLRQGYPGIVLAAIRSGAPILPIVYYGHETFWEDLKHLRRATFNLVVGSPFRLENHGQALSRAVREQMTAEIMYQMAALLPQRYRGLYSDLENATAEYLAFDVQNVNNLSRAAIQAAAYQA